MTAVKTKSEIDSMRLGGQMLAQVLNKLANELEVGMSTKDLAEIAKKELKSLGGKPAFLGYQGFPEVLCVSINEEVVHGIPNSTRIISEGDIVSMDFGVIYEGLITDSAISVIAGQGNKQKEQLLNITKKSMHDGISVLKNGVSVGDIAFEIQKTLESEGYGIVRDLVGHGVGHYLHEPPNIPNYGMAGTGPRLKAGMTIAIEPMSTLGGHSVRLSSDGWTVHTTDKSLSAHFEHTVLITENGYEILTSI